MRSFFTKSKGFTNTELIVVMGLFAILVAVASVSLLSAQRSALVFSGLDPFLADVKQQQIKAMVGDSEGGSSASSYGIYFASDRYVLFQGTVYDSMDPDNFEVLLPENVVFSSIAFPSSQVVFSQLSGEIAGYVDGSNFVTLSSTQGPDSTTITFNAYGVFEQIN